ncbi:BT0820 family HAD-type phosphatase [Chitinophaga nivalis]|uniref:Hydrolase n=1 Tax=Chitinophaga nivalis TaxID=2991709 RepID=A0ABT3IPA0_9BACT|nr:hypothetical protein [Chitinophaga nivalis]MCW3464532.1 hypothetical protein [Chitinophaga nivalis]MCW3485777.1 hypothetical protein [Chitinophaga nivalis]
MRTAARPQMIAVDFDGTIVEHAYPAIGPEMLFAFATLRALQQKGHRLILWTWRTGKPLEAAVAHCRQHGVVFDAVNENYPGEIQAGHYSRKIHADIFIDDRNVGGFPGWEYIWQLLHPEGGVFEHRPVNAAAHYNVGRKRKKWWPF